MGLVYRIVYRGDNFVDDGVYGIDVGSDILYVIFSTDARDKSLDGLNEVSCLVVKVELCYCQLLKFWVADGKRADLNYLEFRQFAIMASAAKAQFNTGQQSLAIR